MFFSGYPLSNDAFAFLHIDIYVGGAGIWCCFHLNLKEVLCLRLMEAPRDSRNTTHENLPSNSGQSAGVCGFLKGVLDDECLNDEYLPSKQDFLEVLP